MKLWLTADTHFHHTNIIQYCSRPFNDVNHMNLSFVNNWNACVQPEDWIIHCGDVAMGHYLDSKPIVSALSGHKVLLRGNHDRNKFVQVYKDLGWHVMNSLCVNNVLFQHHPIDFGVQFDYDLVVHGHSHGGLTKERHIDVGVDSSMFIKYQPIDACQVLHKIDVYGILVTLNNLFL